MNTLIESIKKHEGFVDHVYKDSLGKDTIGYGTLMPITEKEASLILEHRLKQKIKELETKEHFYNQLQPDKKAIIAEMAYQIGVNGVLKFKKMWAALKKFNYEIAAKEMLDSRWAVQTPNRAKELSERMKK